MKIMKKVHRVIKFNQNTWLKPVIDMTTKLRKKAKLILRKTFWSWSITQFFGRAMEYIRKHRNIKLVTTERGTNYLVSEPNYHTTKFFHGKFIGYKKEKN